MFNSNKMIKFANKQFKTFKNENIQIHCYKLDVIIICKYNNKLKCTS